MTTTSKPRTKDTTTVVGNNGEFTNLPEQHRSFLLHPNTTNTTTSLTSSSAINASFYVANPPTLVATTSKFVPATPLPSDESVFTRDTETITSSSSLPTHTTLQQPQQQQQQQQYNTNTLGRILDHRIETVVSTVIQETVQTALATAQQKHALEMQVIQEAFIEEHSEKIRELKDQHAEELEALTLTLLQETKDHENEVKELQEDQQVVLENLQREHAEKVQAVRLELHSEQTQILEQERAKLEKAVQEEHQGQIHNLESAIEKAVVDALAEERIRHQEDIEAMAVVMKNEERESVERAVEETYHLLGGSNQGNKQKKNEALATSDSFEEAVASALSEERQKHINELESMMRRFEIEKSNAVDEAVAMVFQNKEEETEEQGKHASEIAALQETFEIEKRNAVDEAVALALHHKKTSYEPPDTMGDEAVALALHHKKPSYEPDTMDPTSRNHDSCPENSFVYLGMEDDVDQEARDREHAERLAEQERLLSSFRSSIH